MRTRGIRQVAVVVGYAERCQLDLQRSHTSPGIPDRAAQAMSAGGGEGAGLRKHRLPSAGRPLSSPSPCRAVLHRWATGNGRRQGTFHFPPFLPPDSPARRLLAKRLRIWTATNVLPVRRATSSSGSLPSKSSSSAGHGRPAAGGIVPRRLWASLCFFRAVGECQLAKPRA